MVLKRLLIVLAFIVALFGLTNNAHAQGLHFSQYFNAPMLMNPANTALMSSNDFRLGINYRNQWASVPVPFNTFSGFADFQLLKNQNLTNWMGIGAAMFTDKAGDGQLTLNRYQGFIAYHIQTGNFSMVSAGFSVGYAQRTVDFNRLTFDAQWDGFKFDPSANNAENGTVNQTKFYDVSAGVNYAYYPNDDVYVKLGIGLAHINQPKESFYSFDNKVQMRPTINLDALFITSSSFTLNPSVYYTRQGSAQELMYGLQIKAFLSEDNLGNPTNVLTGVYHRWSDAVVPMLGFEWAGVKFIASYDITMSDLGPAVRSQGAFELAIMYQGLYSGYRDKMNCPRF